MSWQKRILTKGGNKMEVKGFVHFNTREGITVFNFFNSELEAFRWVWKIKLPMICIIDIGTVDKLDFLITKP